MSIREIRWQNFRPFRDTGWLEIRPITVVIGANNSGKSSLLDPLLLMKQTLRSKQAQSSLVLRGDFVNAGSFSDIVYQHDESAPVTFGVRFHPHLSPDDVEDLPELGEVPPSECEVTFRASQAPGVVDLYRYAIRDHYDRPLLTRTLRSRRSYTLTELDRWASDSQSDEELGGPSDQAARRAVDLARPNHFLFVAEPIWEAALKAATRPKENEGDSQGLLDTESIQLSSSVTKYMSAIEFTYAHIQGSLDRLFFLGPLREDPKRLYEISGDAPPDVGVRGQYSPEVLLRGRGKALFRQVNTWLRRFDLPGRLACEEPVDNTFKLVLKDSAITEPTNFADVGFGFSQLLPLLVQGLTAPRRSLLITEQPEIHLNPRLQSRLSNFFLEINKRGVDVLLETHSEHLILGIRRLVAEGKLNTNDVAIYFVEPSESGSSVRKVEVRANGNIDIEDWPKGFFEDSLREAFAIAEAQSRRRSAN